MPILTGSSGTSGSSTTVNNYINLDTSNLNVGNVTAVGNVSANNLFYRDAITDAYVEVDSTLAGVKAKSDLLTVGANTVTLSSPYTLIADSITANGNVFAGNLYYMTPFGYVEVDSTLAGVKAKTDLLTVGTNTVTLASTYALLASTLQTSGACNVGGTLAVTGSINSTAGIDDSGGIMSLAGITGATVTASSGDIISALGNVNLVTNTKAYNIAGSSVLSRTTLGATVVNSSLTSIGTLTALNVLGNTLTTRLSVTGNAVMGGKAYISGPLAGADILPSGLTIGTNYNGTNDVDLVAKNATNGSPAFIWYSSTGSSTAFTSGLSQLMSLATTGLAVSGQLSANTLYVPSGTTTGFALEVLGFAKTQQVCCRVFEQTAATVTADTNVLSGSATVSVDLKPSSLSSFGWQTTGTYAGMYRVPLAGVYRVTYNVRYFSDPSTLGIRPLRYNGSTFTGLVPGDGIILAATDGTGSSRRPLCWTDLISITTAGFAITAQHFAGSLVSWVSLAVELIHAY
jgi:hypothetical protein